MTMRVQSRRDLAADIVELVLVDDRGYRLPPWTPGAHIALAVPGVGERQFSLCGDPSDTTAYRIAVLRESDGRGGTAWIHEHLEVGDEVDIDPPLNHFMLEPAASYRLVAGGIGITPLLPMAAQLAASGADWRLVYLGRRHETMAFLDELAGYGDRVQLIVTQESGRPTVAEVLAGSGEGEAIYACGPESLLADLEAATHGRLHAERFAPKDRGGLKEQDEEFEVELARSSTVIHVAEGVSILSAIEAAGLTPDYSCREGTCGTCETRILAGRADHRDSILSPDEQEADEVMMICVSRSKSPRLVLDL